MLASALVLTAPAAAKPAPFASSHSHAKAASRRPHAARHATRHASSSSAATLYVNGSTGTDASNTCRLSSHPCKTIGYALTQAPAGSTINVAAGTYPEQLTITQNVTVKGVLSNQHKPATIIKPTSVSQQDTDPDGGASTYPIVDFAPGVTSGNLTNIEVNGSGAQSSISGCGPDYIGVFYHDASGTLNTDHVTGIQDPAGLGGCQGGLAIYAATDQTTTVSSTQRRAEQSGLGSEPCRHHECHGRQLPEERNHLRRRGNGLHDQDLNRDRSGTDRSHRPERHPVLSTAPAALPTAS